MSVTSWHNYGYGVCTSDFEDSVPFERLMNLIEMAPNLSKEIHDWVNETNLPMRKSTVLEDFIYNYMEETVGGIAVILRSVIFEVEGIRLLSCDDYNGYRYLMFPEELPWNYNEKEKNLTSEKVDALFQKYLSVVTDIDINPSFIDPEGYSD